MHAAKRTGRNLCTRDLQAMTRRAPKKPHRLDRDLARACEQGDACEAARFIRAGANVNVSVYSLNGVLVPAIVLSVHKGSTACAKLLVDANARLDDTFGPSKEAPLHVCCSRGNSEVAKVLIEAGAQLDVADHLGRSPLFMSCLANMPSMCAVMLAAGANAEMAMSVRNPGATPLYAAALSGATKCVELLCEASVNVNARTSDGATPMLVACQEGHMESAQLLSSYGANRETAFNQCFAPDGSNWAEQLAERHGHLELVQWLKRSTAFTPLCHVQVLTPERATAILRGGLASPVDEDANGGMSPAQIAREHPNAAASPLILRASAPWSPETHALWGAPHRARAVQVLELGYLLAAKCAKAEHGSFVDAWVTHLLPQAITW